MNPTIKNILAIIAGCVIGGCVNMAIIMMSSSVIPPPEGADVTSMEGLKASMHLFQPRHFLMPFLAHALGTLTGAIVAALIATGNKQRLTIGGDRTIIDEQVQLIAAVNSNKMRFAVAVGVIFMVGGIANVMMLPSPMWFNILDIAGAYLPMSYLAAKLVIKKQTV